MCEKADIVAIKERFISSQDQGLEAFEELATYCCQETNGHQRGKLTRLRKKYCALLDMYNQFAEDCKNRSDSSSSEDNDDCEEWCNNNL